MIHYYKSRMISQQKTNIILNLIIITVETRETNAIFIKIISNIVRFDNYLFYCFIYNFCLTDIFCSPVQIILHCEINRYTEYCTLESGI